MADSRSTAGHKRRSRFEEDDEADQPQSKKPSLDVSAAAAKAAELSRELSSKIAAMSSILGQINANKHMDRKPAYRALVLDSQGREVDERGNVIKPDVQQIKTLAANVAVASAAKKKENPYLSHRHADALAAGEAVVDERLPSHSREAKARKALHFVEPGSLVKEAGLMQRKEERKIIAGYTSGRKGLRAGASEEVEGGEEVKEEVLTAEPVAVAVADPADLVPALPDCAPPAMEWWDEPFLPKQRRDQRKLSKAAADQDDFPLLCFTHSRTHRYVQHPLPVKPLVGEQAARPLPLFLTKRERKKMRKANRAEREREKRDQQMLGLLPAAEPKFNLKNFMKVLGDQAVADPSKVEARVLQQMQQRVLNHEMRNQAAKLTPAERKAKKTRKLQEDTSKGVHAAAFRVTDFGSLKHRFKVDVNAQQLFLSGLALICEEKGAGSLVLAEGGPKAIRKFVRLLTERIDWTAVDANRAPPAEHTEEEAVEGEDVPSSSSAAAAAAVPMEQEEEGPEPGQQGQGQEVEDEGSSSSDEDSEDEDEDDLSAGRGRKSDAERRCDLLWTGSLPRKLFSGFKYQECRTAAAARKLLEAKGVAHYWDMVQHADQLLASAHTAGSLF